MFWALIKNGTSEDFAFLFLKTKSYAVGVLVGNCELALMTNQNTFENVRALKTPLNQKKYNSFYIAH